MLAESAISRLRDLHLKRKASRLRRLETFDRLIYEYEFGLEKKSLSITRLKPIACPSAVMLVRSLKRKASRLRD